MKKVICLWAVIILLVQAAPLTAAESSSAANELLIQLTALMDVHEEIYEIRSEALQAVAQFCEQNSYPSLLHARIACDEAMRKLQQMVVPTLTLSDETMLELIRWNVETDALEAEFGNLQVMIEREADDVCMFKVLLYDVTYQVSQQGTLQDWLTLSEETTALNQMYDGLFINNLLLPIVSQTIEEFWCSIPNRWPQLGSKLPQWETDQSVIWSEANEVLKHLEALIGEASAVLGRDAYAVERFADHMTDADMEALVADLNVISDMPTMLPLPEKWLMPEASAIYASYDEIQGDEMPEGLIFYDANVPLEAFLDYVEMLSSCGVSLYQQQGSDAEGWRDILIINNHVLALYWYPNQTAMVAYDPRYLTLEPLTYILCIQQWKQAASP